MPVKGTELPNAENEQEVNFPLQLCSGPDWVLWGRSAPLYAQTGGINTRRQDGIWSKYNHIYNISMIRRQEPHI